MTGVRLIIYLALVFAGAIVLGFAIPLSIPAPLALLAVGGYVVLVLIIGSVFARR